MLTISEHFFSIINFVLTLIFISFVLRSRRPPGSTMAWLLFVSIIPYLGIPLYLFLSNRKFSTRLNKKEPLRQSLKQNNEIAELIISGENAYAKIIELINSAKQQIHISTFIFADDEVGHELVRLLEIKAQQGITVRILLDSFGAFWQRHPKFNRLHRAG